MKPATDDRTVEGNLTGREIGLTIDQDATAHLMNVLTDLYSDRELAVLREYATNARDAHLEAGTPGAIAVTTPTSLRPVLTIQDWGVGLSEDDLERVYTRYGASTKRDSDEATGMLGLGCKAALTYAEQFTLVSVKDGVRVQASVARAPGGGGTLTVVDRRETGEANGVTIQVPAERHNEFRQKAERLFRYWDPGTVELDGRDPADSRTSDRVKLSLSPDLYVEECERSYEDERHLVVQGGIPYPAAIPGVKLPLDQRLVAHVPIGTVHFPPNRETLLDGPNTEAALARIGEEYRRKLASALQKDLDAAPDRPAALRRLGTLSAFGVDDALTYRGNALPQRLEKPVTLAARSHWQAKSHTTQERLEPGLWPDLVWITGFAPAKFNAAHRNKLDAIAPERGWPEPGRYVILRDDEPLPADVPSWVEADRIVAWSGLKAPSAGGGGRRPARKSPVYDLWKDGAWAEGAISAEHLKRASAKRTVLFVHPHGERPSRWSTHPDTKLANRVRTVQELRPDALIVRVPRNREEKFLRLVPEAVLAWDAAKVDAEAFVDAIPAITKRLLARRYEVGSYEEPVYRFAELDPEAVEDPKLAELIRAERELRDVDVDLSALVSRLDRYRQELRVGFDLETDDSAEDPLPYLRTNYPLVAWDGSEPRDLDTHVTLYVNAAYQAAQEQGR